MEPYKAAFLAIAVYLALYYWLKTARPAWEKQSLPGKIGKAPLLAGMEKLQELAALAAVVFGGFTLLVLALDAIGGGAPALLPPALGALRKMHESLKTVEEVWSGALFLFVSAVLGYALYRTLKKSVVENIVSAARSQVAATRNSPPGDAGELPKEMKELREQIAKARSRIADLDPAKANFFILFPQLRAQLDSLEKAYIAMDIERQVDLQWEKEAEPGEGRFAGLRRVLLGSGTFTRLKGAKKVLSMSTTALLLASLIGFQGQGMADSAEEHAIHLRDLQINRSLDKAEKELNSRLPAPQPDKPTPPGTPPPTPSTPPTPQQLQVLQQLSQVYAASFARVWTGGSHDTASADTREQLTRWVLKKHAAATDAHAPAPDSHAPASDSKVAPDSSWTPGDTATANDFERAAADPNFSNPVESDFVKEAIRRGLHRTPPVVAAAAKAKPEDKVAHISEMQDFVLEEGFGAFLEPVKDLLPSDLAKLMAEALQEGVQKLFSKVYVLYRDVFMSSFLRTDDPVRAGEAAQQAVQDIVAEGLRDQFQKFRPGPETNFAEKLRSSQPVATAEDARYAKAAAILDDLPESARKGSERNFANLLSNYDVEFPQSGDGAFQRDRLLSSWGVTDSNGVTARANRALDFEHLKSYSRVGGILLGGAPSGNGTVAFSGLSWTKSTSGYYTLRLTPVNGPAVELGPFPPYLINQALAYASDGRNTVLTMMNGELIGRKQVIIHPAFRNTALGCRLMADDEWIFDYTDSLESPIVSDVRRIINQVGTAIDFYKAAIRALRDPDAPPAPASLPGELETDLRKGVELLRPHAADLQLNVQLLDTMASCAGPVKGNWGVCVKAGATGYKSSLPDKAPVTGFVSQVREGSYSVDKGMNGFLTPPSARDSLWPLTFTVQLTVNDSQRWEFFSNDGVTTVLNGIERDGKSAQLRELRQLCLLQRLFRDSLAGYLGSVFPVELLVKLQQETAGTASTVETPEWLAERGDPTFMREFKSALSAFLKDKAKFEGDPTVGPVLPEIQGCNNAILSSPEAGSIHSQCDWKFSENMRVACAKAWDGKSESSADQIPACRVFDLAYLEQIVDSLYRLQDVLSAKTAVARASELPCAKMPPAVLQGEFAKVLEGTAH